MPTLRLLLLDDRSSAGGRGGTAHAYAPGRVMKRLAIPEAARRRLVKLFRGGYLERFRPYSPRGSYEWTYYIAARGHRLL